MNILGGIGLIATFKRYKDAKKAYEEAIERKETIEAAISNYTNWREKKFDEIDAYDPNANYPLDGVLATFVFRVGNLVGKYCRAKTAIVLTNTSQNTYIIKSGSAVVRIFGAAVQYNKSQKKYINTYLRPNETITIDLPGGVAMLPEEVRGRIRDAICDAAGKRLITSCPKLNLNGVATADIRFDWVAGSGAGSAKSSRYIDTPGTLRYCMEAYYPS